MQNIKIKGAVGEQIALECNGVEISAIITADGLVVDPLEGTRRLVLLNANGVAVAASKFFHRETNAAGVSQILAPIRDSLFDSLKAAATESVAASETSAASADKTPDKTAAE